MRSSNISKKPSAISKSLCNSKQRAKTMKCIPYEEVVKATNHWPANQKSNRALITVALTGEVGEYANLLKKQTLGKPIDDQELIDELGDIMWYFTTLVRTYNLSLEHIMERNAEKVLDRTDKREHYSQEGSANG